MNRSVLTVVVSVAVGAAVALLTGLVDVTPAGLLGATWYGYPLPWLYRLVVGPQYNPWSVDWLKLILDVVSWSLTAMVISVAATVLRPRGSKGMGSRP